MTTKLFDYPTCKSCNFIVGHVGRHSWEPAHSQITLPQTGGNLGAAIRTFKTGATRSQDATRDDPEGYLSPLVLQRFSQHMTKHRTQPDGSIRSSDNWQKGIPLDVYMKGLTRHHQHLWLRHRGWPVEDNKAGSNIEEDLCAIIFNAQGYLYELLKAKLTPNAPPTP